VSATTITIFVFLAFVYYGFRVARKERERQNIYDFKSKDTGTAGTSNSGPQPSTPKKKPVLKPSATKPKSKPNIREVNSAGPKQSKAENIKSQKPHFESHEDAGKYGEDLVRTELKRLKSLRIINGYTKSKNMVVDNQYFEFDFLVMVPNFELVIAEVKYFAGEVFCTKEGKWRQVKTDRDGKQRESETTNASKQVLRARALLKKILKARNLDNWTIKPLVVFTHPDAKIQKGKNEKKPEADMVLLSGLEKFISELRKKDNAPFTQVDFDNISSAIKAHNKEYSRTN